MPPSCVCDPTASLSLFPRSPCSVLPMSIRCHPDRMRWGLCTEEICFPTPGLATFFGMGKAIPIQRGGSIHQKGMATLQSKVNNGDWVHVFAEGRVWQEAGIPLRDSLGRWCSAGGRCSEPWTKVGPFKWGVGKVIANADKTPVVVPFFHLGCDSILPQTSENQLESIYPVWSGRKVTVQFGDPVPVVDLIETYHAKARERALARNAQREARLAAAQAAAASGKRSGSAAATGGWLPWWLGGSVLPSWLGGSKGSATTPAAAAAASSVVKPTNKPVGLSPEALEPVNTVEAASDHSGASAHVAGLARKVGHEAVAADKAAVPGDDLPHRGPGLKAKAKELEARAVETAKALESAALETAKDLEAAAERTAKDIETRARELMHKLWELEPWSKPGSQGPKAPTPGGEAAPAEDAAAATPVTARAVELYERLKAKWNDSVSVPSPERIKLPRNGNNLVASNGSSATLVTGTPAAASQAAPTSTARGAWTRTSSGAEVSVPVSGSPDAAFPLSDSPVVEMVPSRKLRTGATVPAYIDGPMHIKPPDHDYLTPAEAVEEENIRLKLYADIVERLQAAVVELERSVMARRKAQGYVEPRAMA